MVGRPSQSVRSGWQAIPECREWSTSPLEVSGVVVRPSQSVGRPSRCISRPSERVKSGSGRKAIPECLEWSAGPPKVSRVVNRPSRSVGSSGRPSRIVRNGRQAIPEWSEGYPRVS